MTTLNDLLAELRASATETQSYSYALDMDGEMSVHAALDRLHNPQRVQLTRKSEPHCAEVFWEQSEGYGRKLDSKNWHQLTGAPFPDMLDHVILMLEAAEDPTLTETDGGLQVRWSLQDIPIPVEPVAFFSEFFGERTERNVRFLDQIQAAMENVTGRVTVQIDPNAMKLWSARVDIQKDDQQREIFVGFDYDPPEVSALPETALDAVEPTLPAFMLLLQLPRSGWCQTINHGPWAQASLDLIATKDTENEYSTVTNTIWGAQKFNVKTASAKGGTSPTPGKHHPIVLGAVFEDYGQLPSNPYTNWFTDDADYKKNASHYARQPYLRDFHHYGGYDKGVENRWYFDFHPGSIPSTTLPGDRYYTARDWGFGGNRIDP